MVDNTKTTNKLCNSKEIIENIPGMVYQEENTGHIKIISGSKSLCGYTPCEINSGTVTWESLIIKEDKKPINENVPSPSINKDSIIQDYRIITKDGQIKWVEDRKLHTISEKTRTRYIYGLVLDISDRKITNDESGYKGLKFDDQVTMTSKKLDEKNRLLQMVFNNSKDMIYHMSLPDGEYEYVSPASQELFGYPPEVFYRKPLLIRECIHPDWVEYFQNEWAGLLEGKMSPSYEYQIIDKNGVTKWCHQRNTLIKDHKGVPIAIEGIVTDITARKNAERGLQLALEKFQETFQNSPISLWILDFSTPIHKIENLNYSNTRDLKNYFKEHPEFLNVLLTKIKIIDINPNTLKMLDVSTKQDFFKQYKEGTFKGLNTLFRMFFLAIITGKLHLRKNIKLNTLEGKRKDILASITISEDQNDYSQIIVAMINITKQKETEWALEERIKELKCLYNISDLFMNETQDIIKLFDEIIAIIPQGWQSPENTAVRIKYRDKTYLSTNFKESTWKINSENKNNNLIVEVHLRKNIGFLIEEKDLLDEIVERISLYITNQEQKTILKNQNDQFLAILSHFPEILYVCDPETYEVIFVNETFKNMLDGDPIGKKCYEAFQGLTSPCDFCTNEIIMNQNEPYTWEYFNPKLSRHFIITDQLINWPDNRQVRFEFAMDITKTKAYEKTLSIQNEIDEVFLSISDEEMYLKVLDVLLKAFSSEFGVFGYINETGDLICPSMTRDVWSKCNVPEKDIVFPRGEWGHSIWARALKNNEIYYSNESFTIPEGHIPINNAIAAPITHRGKVIGLLNFANKEQGYDDNDVNLLQSLCNTIAPVLNARLERDIEEREKKKAEMNLKKTLHELKRSNQELEQFAYVASHDLQEPLRMVSSYVQLIERRYKDKLDKDGEDFIDFAVDGAKRMQNLINDLLLFSRIHTRGGEFKEIEMDEVVTRALENLRMFIDENNAKVIFDELPSIVADKNQMVQLFQNLIHNAIKFHGEKPPEVRISYKKDKDKWFFSIKDNGIGIDPKYFDRIFLIFQRLHKKGKYSGTGIGLSICKRIVDRHGGKIWVESEGFGGSTFRFSIPLLP